MEENFLIDLVGTLQQSKSKKRVNDDIKTLEKTINMLRLTATFAKADTKRELNTYIKQLSDQLSTIKLKAKIDSKNLKSEVNKALNNVSFKDIDVLNIDENKTKLRVQKIIADAKAYAERNPISIGVNIESKKNKLDNDLTAYLNKYTKITESSVLLEEADKVRDLIDTVTDKKSLTEATDAFRLFKSEVSATGYTSKSTADKVKSMLSHITKIGSAFGVASMFINSFVKSLKTLRENDTILTEISKTSEMTKNQLKELGDEAFKVASKYGQLSSYYLLAVQEMARSGYEETSKELGELSLLAQSAGDMTAENANNYLLATDAAYKYSGSIEKLNAALDGANYISNKNSASLTDIADATRVSASFAANAGVAIDELTAAEATMIATTKRSGSEIGRAFRSIILNLQQVSGEFDGEIIDEEQLKKVEERCHSLGVELEYVKDGIATLRNPIEVLKDLAEVYNSLPDNSAEKQGLIADLGGKYHANALSALLSRWDLYEKMLTEFSQGAGSALKEAEKTANSWEGRLNSLSNSFTSFVNTLTNKEMIMGGVSFFDRLIQGAEKLTNTIGEIPVVLTTLNTAMTALKADYGITQLVNPETKKLDLEGNIFGIDISKIKNLKKHYEDAEEAIQLWNDAMLNGENDLESFGNKLIKNNAQFKAYIQTTSKDAPASLKGYRQYLQQTGQATEDLRLKTILLNTALTFLGGIAVQAVITGIAKAFDKFNETVEESQEKVNDINSKISDLKTQIEELNSLEYKSDFDKQKISQLERELDLQERILEIEQKRLYQNQIGTSFSDYFDADSLVTKQKAEDDRYNKEGYKYLSVRFKADKESLDDIDAELASLQERLDNGLVGHERFEVEGKIEKLTEKRNKLLEEQQTIEEQLTLNMGDYLKNYQTAQEAVDSGLLTGSDLEKAESMAEYWNQLYQDSAGIVTNIQKMNGTYDNTIDLLEEMFGNISRDDLALLSDDDKRIALSFDPDNIIGFEELQQKIAEIKGDIEELNETDISIAPTISSSIQQIATQLEPQFAKLGDAYREIFKFDDNGKEIFSLDSIDNSMLEELRQAFAEIKEEVGVTFDASKLDSFFDTLTNGNSTAEQVQQAFNDLATAYLYSTDTLEQLNSETANAIEKQLEELGVQNAAEIVADELTAKTEELIVAKEYLAQTGQALASATDDEVNAFILEQIEAGNCGEALALLQLKKMLVNGTLLDTSTDINNVLALAQAAGIATDALTKLQSLKAAFDNAQASGDYGAMSIISAEMAKAKTEIETEITNFKPVEIQFDSASAAKSAKKAGSSAGDAYVNAFEDELKKLQTLRDQGKITEKRYLDYLRKLYQKFFKDKKKYAEQYAKYEHEYLQGMKSLYESALSGITSMLDKQISAYGDAKSAALESLEAQRDAAIEAKKAEKARYEQEIDLIDKKITTKEKAISDIQDEIDLMRELNEQKDRENKLAKAKYDYERMMNQHSILQYSEDKGISYVQDLSGARDKKQAVEDAELEIAIANKEKDIKLIEKDIKLLEERKSSINGQIDLLDKQIDEISKMYDKMISESEQYWDNLIKGLQDYKSRWEELGEIEENAKLISTLKQLGIETDDILNMSEEAFSKFKDEYIGILADIYSGNDSMLSALSDTTGRSVDEMGSYITATQGYIDCLSGLGESLNPVSEAIGNVDENMESLSSTASEANENLTDTVSKTDTVATNVGNLNASLSETNGLVTEEQTAFDNLKTKIDEVIEAINLKTEAIQAEQEAVGIATSNEMADFLLLKEKILEVKETLESFGTQDEGLIHNIATAIESLNEISLEDGIIGQFAQLKEAVEAVASAISGGGESSGSEGQGGNSGSASGGESGGKGSQGSGSRNSLTGAITEMGELLMKSLVNLMQKVMELLSVSLVH